MIVHCSTTYHGSYGGGCVSFFVGSNMTGGQASGTVGGAVMV